MKPSEITRFSHRYAFLSNFYPLSVMGWERLPPESLRPIVWYPTVEHAFQAAKTFSQIDRRKIHSAATPGQAKRLGRRVELRADWDEIKVSVMSDLVFQKFMRSWELGEKLINTGRAKLIEGNRWHDNFWGDCYCIKCTGIEGQNHLGKILMECRSAFTD